MLFLFFLLFFFFLQLPPFARSQSITEIKAPSISIYSISRPSWFHLPPAQDPTLTYVTINLCSPPSSSNPQTQLPPIDYQHNLILIVSNSSGNTLPSPSNLPVRPRKSFLSSHHPTGDYSDLRGGFANVTLVNSVGLWIYLRPPPSSTPSLTWSFQLALSTQAPLHAVNGFPAFKLEDTDDSNALLTASDSSLFQPSTARSALSLQEFTPIILPTPNNLQFGLSSSTCYLSNLRSSISTLPVNNISPSLTTRTTGIGLFSSQPTDNSSDHDYRISDQAAGLRTQYFISNLQLAQNYSAWLFQPTGTVDNVQTGRLWPYINFRTKASKNCRLVHDLAFCPSVAYSVPSSPSQSTNSLVNAYNQTISGNLTNFRTVLSTYPCNNGTSGRYSFVSGCTDCLRAYNDWLCSVSMPRCTDPDPRSASQPTTRTILQDRNNQLVLTRTEPNSSRTPSLTDKTVYPYGEILPCSTTCTLVAATCPPLIGWGCPLDSVTLDQSYNNLKTLNGLEVVGGQQTQAGLGGPRATDRFGNVFCNALDSDMAYSRLGSTNSLLGSNQNLIYTKFIILYLVYNSLFDILLF